MTRLFAFCFALLTVLFCSARAQLSVVSALTETFDTAPGATVQGKFVLSNPGDAPARARVAAADYTFSADGQVRFDPPGSLPRSNARWLTLGAEIVTVPPGAQLAVPYTLRVPASGTLPGSFWSVILIEPLGPEDPRSGGVPDERLAIRQVVRYGVQVITNLGGGKRSLAFARPELGRSGAGQYSLALDLVNDGEQHLRPDVYAEVYGQDGQLAQRLSGATTRLYPGTSARQRFDFTNLPSGAYRVVVIADGGQGDVFGVQYDFHVGP